MHRDLSPRNILLGRDYRVKLADFGLARITGLNEKNLSCFFSELQYYQAPEMVRKYKMQFFLTSKILYTVIFQKDENDYQLSSDVYSCGQVLLTLYTPRHHRAYLEHVLKTNYHQNELPYYMNTHLSNLVRGFSYQKVLLFNEQL